MEQKFIQTKELIREMMISFFKDALPRLNEQRSNPILVANRELEQEFSITRSKLPLGWLWILSDKSCIFYNQENYYYFATCPKVVNAWTRNGNLKDLFYLDDYYIKFNFHLEAHEVSYVRENENHLLSSECQGMALMIIGSPSNLDDWKLNRLICEHLSVHKLKHSFFDDEGIYRSNEEKYRILTLFKEAYEDREIPIKGRIKWDYNLRTLCLEGYTNYPKSTGILYHDVQYVFFDEETGEQRPQSDYATPAFIKQYGKSFKKELHKHHSRIYKDVFFRITGFDEQGRPKIMLDVDNKKHPWAKVMKEDFIDNLAKVMKDE